MSLIEYTLDETGVATITFNRDEKRNAINKEMAEQILVRLEQGEQDSRVVILRANPGVTVWCAGHDLAELDPQALHENPTLDIVDKIQTMPVPAVAMVEGAVYGGGLLILLSADIVIAAKNAKAAITSNKLGIPLAPELYAFWLRVMGLHKVKELLFTGTAISAEDAYHAGLYNHVVDNDQLDRLTHEIAAKIIECSADGLANAKYQLNLIAMQAALTESERKGIAERNLEILNSPATKERISALLAAVRKE